ncbi:MAG: tetratricopeptide repeat protein [Bacteroidales bacterium]|nr:tetratricopeptide repeat protein [Bacteroidales bacterium]
MDLYIQQLIVRGLFILLFIQVITLSVIIAQDSGNYQKQEAISQVIPEMEGIENSDDLISLSWEYISSDSQKSKLIARKALSVANQKNEKLPVIDALYLLGRADYLLHAFDSSEYFLQKALNLSREHAEDSTTCKILIALSDTYKEIEENEKAIKGYKEAIDIAGSKGYIKQHCNASFLLGDLYHAAGNYSESLKAYQLCADHIGEIKNKDFHANLYNRIGIIFYEIGSYENALNYYMKSLDIVEDIGNRAGIANALNNIGILYYDWGNKEKALEYYQHSLRIEEELGHEYGLAGSYNNIGIIYSDWNQNDLAINYYKKALRVYEKYEDQIGIANALNNIGESEASLGKYKEALDNLLESLNLEKQYGTGLGTAQSFHAIGKVYFKMGDVRKAREYNVQSQQLSDSLGLNGMLLENMFLNYQIENSEGNYKASLDYYIKYSEIKQNLYDKEFQDRLTDLQLKHEIDKSEREREILISDNQRKEKEIEAQRTYLIVIFILMLIFGLLVYYDIKGKILTNKKLKKFNSELTENKETLTQTLVELQKSETKYKTLVENAPTGILYIDTHGNILGINKNLLNILGSPNEAETKKINVLQFKPIIKSGIAQEIKHCIETGESVAGESEYTSKWGKHSFLKYTITPVNDRNTARSNIIINIEDITLPKQADQMIRESEHKYRMLVENSLQAMLIIQDMRIIFGNRELEEITGYTMEEMEKQGRHWLQIIVHPEDVTRSIREVINALKGKSGSTKQIYRIIRKNNEVRWIETLGSVVKFKEKRAIMMVAIDITERKTAEEILIKSEKELLNVNAMKDKFFSIIAHDLKNPFSSILGFANLLYEAYDNFSESQRKSFVKNIVETSENTFKLLQNLLEWARTQTGNFEYNPKQINLSTITNENLAIFKSSLKNKKIAVDLDIPVRLSAWADENMIKSVVRNLISNAIKFTHEGGKIRIEAAAKNGMVKYNVEDTGTGISKENLKKLFRIDDQLKMPGTHNENGSGIGLLICKELIEINKGEISAESHESKGSRFSFTLPNRSV